VVDRQQQPGPPYGLVPLKNSRRTPHRAVPAPAELLDYFGRLAAPGSGARLCWRADGTPLTARQVSYHVGKAVRAEKLPAGTTFHALRHAYASTLIDAGESVAVVAERLGDTPAEVLATYVHLFAAAPGRTREIISGALTLPRAGR
jgi:integrase